MVKAEFSQLKGTSLTLNSRESLLAFICPWARAQPNIRIIIVADAIITGHLIMRLRKLLFANMCPVILNPTKESSEAGF
jgi:hypothetical protein